MSALTLPTDSPVSAPVDDDLNHYFCCSKTVALCGYVDGSSEWVPWTDEPEPDDCPTCVVAHQLSPTECRGCAA